MKFSLQMSPRAGRLEDGLAGDGPMSGRLYERSFCRPQPN